MQPKAYRKIAVLLLILLVVMQFIQPKKNIGDPIPANDISKVYSIPPDVHKTLVNKCYDCHSNNTKYPWYANIQPVGWWLAAHVHDGKEHVNFSEFKTYSRKDVTHKLEDLEEVIEDGSMPLKPYTILHKDSKVSPAEANAIKAWLSSLEPAMP
jgi:hypothetical protein